MALGSQCPQVVLVFTLRAAGLCWLRVVVQVSVRLGAAPSTDVTVTLNPASLTALGVTASPSSLTFTPATFGQTQSFTLTASLEAGNLPSPARGDVQVWCVCVRVVSCVWAADLDVYGPWCGFASASAFVFGGKFFFFACLQHRGAWGPTCVVPFSSPHAGGC